MRPLTTSAISKSTITCASSVASATATATLLRSRVAAATTSPSLSAVGNPDVVPLGGKAAAEAAALPPLGPDPEVDRVP